jgi:hypothetical protein
MKLIIDRFEGDYAVCEDEDQKFRNIKLLEMPEGVKEGDIIEMEMGNVTINKEATSFRSEEIEKLFNDLSKSYES